MKMVPILIMLLHLAIGNSRANTEDLATCCNLTTIQFCQDTCRELAHNGTWRRQPLYSSCVLSDHTFWTCVNETFFTTIEEVTTPVPSRFLHCCVKSPKPSCRDRCFEVFQGGDKDESVQSLRSALFDTCGEVNVIESDFWSCMLFATPSPVTDVTIPPPVDADWPRLQCCFKANSSMCRESCFEVLMDKARNPMFVKYRSCLESSDEKLLSTCILDVEVPCKLGCSGMQFCRNFNNRPSQAFRRCDVVVDGQAKQRYLSWLRLKLVVHPLWLTGIPVTSIENCLPEMWQAAACVIHLEPCVASSHMTQLCRNDCLRLLESCSNSTASPETICDIIAPESVNCIPLNNFLKPSSFGNDVIAPAATAIKSPCDPNPCQDGLYCVINRLCDVSEKQCTAYDCHPQCVVGKSPGVTFINGSVVRFSVRSDAPSRCFGYFNCTSPGDTSGNHQITFIPTNRSCETEKSCTLPSEEVLDHLSHSWIDCNICYCNYGRLICTNRSCLNRSSLMSLNCNCNRTYAPVCSDNGITFPNKCTALCLGYSAESLDLGDCGSLYQCSRIHSNCAVGSTCIPLRHTCLAKDFSNKICQQFRCESSVSCKRSASQSPVCDDSNVQHASLCSFLGTHKSFSYWGYCEEECNKDNSVVCGANGETFLSRCHAHSMHISVDYLGKCLAVPRREYNNGIAISRCEEITCPSLDFPGCRSITPQGACCPICGTSIIILYDKKILGDNLAYLNQDYISSHDVIERLQYHIDYIQCHVFGHVLEDSTLMLIFTPDSNSFNKDVLSEVCYHEAIKLSTLINNQSPIVTNDIFLSHLVAAFVEDGTEPIQTVSSQISVITTSSSSKDLSPTVTIPLLCVAIMILLW